MQASLKTRSIDDIRNYWNLKILPIMDKSHQVHSDVTCESIEGVKIWQEKDDIILLQGVVDQEVEECDEQIDFDPEVIGNSRLSSENEARWQLLLKGLGSTSPGKRYNPMELASKMIRDIETKDERYVAYQPLTKPRSTA